MLGPENKSQKPLTRNYNVRWGRRRRKNVDPRSDEEEERQFIGNNSSINKSLLVPSPPLVPDQSFSAWHDTIAPFLCCACPGNHRKFTVQGNCDAPRMRMKIYLMTPRRPELSIWPPQWQPLTQERQGEEEREEESVVGSGILRDLKHFLVDNPKRSSFIFKHLLLRPRDTG